MVTNLRKIQRIECFVYYVICYDNGHHFPSICNSCILKALHIWRQIIFCEHFKREALKGYMYCCDWTVTESASLKKHLTLIKRSENMPSVSSRSQKKTVQT
ncbi:hypothetical protein NQD34_011320 [Periophthalmus magnuspinnatus]|nr:hypothetical protein NQD34_011320 [Periophthalmus magnuspinnatus]